MVSSGTGQMPVKPSQGVLFLLQRNGLMAMNQSERLVVQLDNCLMREFVGANFKSHHLGFNFCYTRPMLNFGSCCYSISKWSRCENRSDCVLLLLTYFWFQKPGKANGSCRSTQLLIHALDHGARPSEDFSGSAPTRNVDRCYP